MKELYENCIEHGGQVLMEMKEKFEDLAMNIRVRMLAGKRYFGTSSDDQESRQCQEALRCLSYIAGMFMASDTVPFLGWLDVVKGFVRETKKTARELDCVRESLILGGNDTTLITLTWAISLLLNNPQKLKKAQDELDIHVGKRCQANQSDIKNLLYSEAICDSSIWSNSLEFQQERFLTEHAHLDVKRLLHGYNLEMSLSDKLVDMGESPGMTIPKGNTIGGHIDPKATFSAL
nr:xanthotoxin 5-hydroxylase CYP82C2-like [Ziziphus jujuba var. spinosa]